MGAGKRHNAMTLFSVLREVPEAARAPKCSGIHNKASKLIDRLTGLEVSVSDYFS